MGRDGGVERGRNMVGRDCPITLATWMVIINILEIVRGSCKKFCHWVRITSVLRFIKHILLQTFKYSPFTETHFCNLFTQSRKADK